MRYYGRLLVLIVFLSPIVLSAQVAQVEYGKNRVQYHDDFEDWELYESKNFVVYWYGKARNQGVFTLQDAEENYKDIYRLLDHPINDKIEIIVYADVSDFRQSNIGQEETFEFIEGMPKVVGNKMFVYYDGDRQNFEQQIRGGMAQIILENMFFGSNLQELVQNAVSSEMPVWYRQGLIKYIGHGWPATADAELRNWFAWKKNNRFKKLDKTESILLGQSFWHFIATKYGKEEISNLLYVSRINRNLDDAMYYIFGQNKKELQKAWQAYYTDTYNKEMERFTPYDEQSEVDYKKKKKSTITQFLYSPDGSSLATLENQQGKIRIYLTDLASGERKKVFKHGFRNNLQATDYKYPLMSWLPNGGGLFVLFEHRDDIVLQLINPGSKKPIEQILPERYERIYAMAALSENELIFSGLSLGQIDLYYYTPNTRQSNRLTQDIYDDLDVQVVVKDNVKQLLFRSNRPDPKANEQLPDTLAKLGPHKPYLYVLGQDSIWAPELLTPPDIQNMVYHDGKLYYLSAQSGVSQVIGQGLASGSPQEYMTTDPYNTLHFAINPTTNDVVRNYVWEDKERVRQEPLADQAKSVIVTEATTTATGVKQGPVRRSVFDAKTRNPLPKNNDNVIRTHEKSDEGKQYLFQSRWNDIQAKQVPVDSSSDENMPDDSTVAFQPLFPEISGSYDQEFKFDRLKLIPYRTKFRIHSFKTDLDNNPLFGGLNSFAGFREEYQNPPVGILSKAVFKDVFEDYVFEGGVRIPTSFDGSEYFLLFQNNKKRIDKEFALYRKSEFEEDRENSNALKNRTTNIILLGQATFKYPIDIFQSVSATGTIRQDKFVFNSSNIGNLDIPNEENKRLGLRLTYVFDNAIDIDLNLREGTKAKVYVESLKKFQFTVDPWNLSFDDGFMTTIGFDARHYLSLANHMVLGMRVAGATSFGSEKILNYLGGVDNGLFDKFNMETPQASGSNFAYTALQPNLRGFDYNVRNGSTFTVVNTELRIPVFKYINPNIRLSLLRHFQLIGFFDAGLAWEGASPFDDDNPINIVEVQNPPTVNVKVNYFRDPLVAGYGVGLRTMIFGYFVRADYAWGIETREVQSPKLHLAFGVDF